MGDEGNTAESAQMAVTLMPRDKELFVHLAIARYLTTAQIERLLFEGADESIVRRRLGKLTKANYLRRVPYRDSFGEPALAWTFEMPGYLAARRVFSALPPVPTYLVKPDQLEHDLMLNSLYVELAVTARAKRLPVDRRPFRWVPSAAARCPWREYDRASGRHESRMLLPDAILELPHARRRIFIEAETGSHTLGFRTETESRGSTKSKIERYARYVADPASADLRETFYEAAFADTWAPELLFVVPNSTRRDHIRDYVQREWLPSNAAVALTVRALTFEEASSDLASHCGLASQSTASAPRATLSFTPAELKTIYSFYNAANQAIGSARELARKYPRSRLPAPEYPANHQEMKELCKRIAEALK